MPYFPKLTTRSKYSHICYWRTKVFSFISHFFHHFIFCSQSKEKKKIRQIGIGPGSGQVTVCSHGSRWEYGTLASWMRKHWDNYCVSASVYFAFMSLALSVCLTNLFFCIYELKEDNCFPYITTSSYRWTIKELSVSRHEKRRPRVCGWK